MIKILCFIFTRITLFIEYDFLDLKCSIIQDRDVFRFLLLVITTKPVGILRFAAYSLSHSDKVNAGAKLPECTSASQCQ
jgi:hypothetical protein